jgi:hypothetical protein
VDLSPLTHLAGSSRLLENKTQESDATPFGSPRTRDGQSIAPRGVIYCWGPDSVTTGVVLRGSDQGETYEPIGAGE